MGVFIRHSWCPHCGSRDAYSLYADGSAHCFSCKTTDSTAYGGDGRGGYKKVAGDLIQYEDLLIKPLPARKITKSTCELYGYAIGSYGGQVWHVAPYYHRGTLCAQHLRGQDKAFKWLGKAENLEMFGQRSFPAGGRQIVITEGELDAMSIAQMYEGKLAVVSIPSGTGSAKKAIQNNLEYLESFDEVILSFDNDDPGREARDQVVGLFQPGKVKLFQYPSDSVKDANDLLMEGRGVLILDGIRKAQPYRPDGIISGADLFEQILEPDEPGLSTPYPLLDKMTLGTRKGELVLFTAGSGIGKSTLVHELGYHMMMEHNQSLGIIALEEKAKRTALRYCSIDLNRPLHMTREGVTLEQLTDAFKRTAGSNRLWLYDHFGSTRIDGLLQKFRYLAAGCGVDWIILDHISIVVSGLDEGPRDDERRLIDRLMTKLRTLIESTGIGVLAVVHLKRREGQGKSYNEGGTVSLTQLRGSGALEQLSDTVIALERDQQGDSPDESTIRVLKCRYTGETGLADVLRYDKATGRLLPKGSFTPTGSSAF